MTTGTLFPVWLLRGLDGRVKVYRTRLGALRGRRRADGSLIVRVVALG